MRPLRILAPAALSWWRGRPWSSRLARLWSGVSSIRKSVAVSMGLIAGQYVVLFCLDPALSASPAFGRLARRDRARAVFMSESFRWSWRLGPALVLLGLVNFLEVHGLVTRRKERGQLPPCPLHPERTQLVLGEAHNQDGSRSDEPWWVAIPEKGMCTGILVVGATGRGKTASALYPYLKQLIELHAEDPLRRLAGLVIDPKGNMAGDVKRMCEAAGRGGDFYELSMPGARYNVLNRPDLGAPALAGHITDVMRNVNGSSKDSPFWEVAARELATQTLRLARLAEQRPPTMADLFRVSSSPRAFAEKLAEVEARKNMSPEEHAEYESLRYWYEYLLQPMDDRTRVNIVATLSGLCSLFDEPAVKQCWCPVGEEETFAGFDRLIEQGKIVVLSLPQVQWKSVAVTVGTMAKLNYQDAVLRRLARAEAANAAVGRLCFFLADEYDAFVTAPGDGTFLSKCREARCVNIMAVQSYTSLGAKLRDRAVVEQLLAQLATKIWFGLEDNETAEAAAKLCGRIDREHESHTMTETSSRAGFSFVDRRSISEGSVTATASTTRATRDEYLFPPRVFTQLATFVTVMKVFDGEKGLPPWVVYTKPSFRDPNLSWFDTSRAS